jgi:hypothetical protein
MQHCLRTVSDEPTLLIHTVYSVRSNICNVVVYAHSVEARDVCIFASECWMESDLKQHLKYSSYDMKGS